MASSRNISRQEHDIIAERAGLSPKFPGNLEPLNMISFLAVACFKDSLVHSSVGSKNKKLSDWKKNLLVTFNSNK